MICHKHAQRMLLSDNMKHFESKLRWFKLSAENLSQYSWPRLVIWKLCGLKWKQVGDN